MQLRRILLYSTLLTTFSFPAIAQDSSSSSTPKHTKKPSTPKESTLDSGSIANNVYRNKTLAMSCKIPEGWVLRTEEMNSSAENSAESKETPDPAQLPASSVGAKALLAAFSRPPEARAE